MKNIGVATIDAVGFITTFAPTESIAIFSTVITRDFVGTASIAAPYFGDTVRASILVTLRALFEINAVHTITIVTGSTDIYFLTVKAVSSFTLIARTTNVIHTSIILTILTILFRAVIASVLLCSIEFVVCRHIQHIMLIVSIPNWKVATALQAATCSTTQIIIESGEESMKIGFSISLLSPHFWELQIL
mmetsp:Transcript_3444/g.4999  ORF Transcript_3444/g.4999 Transcript_3444/m.4999 type:complete len:190 (-) Transcript_3444:585-1154(-)